MQRRRWLSMAILGLASSAAFAGLVQSVPVSVTANADGSGTASGHMLTARTSANAVEYIGCGVRRYEDSTGAVTAYGFCQATTAASVNGFCSTQNAELLDAIQSISAYSYVLFSWRADGTCRMIGNSTQSFYLP